MRFKRPQPVRDPLDYDAAYQYALFLLNLSMRTTKEMQEKMTRRGYSSSVIKEVINNLVADRFLDDSNYAEVFINSMKNYKTWGRFMMKKKMYEKKLPKSLIEISLAEHFSEQEELQIAKRFIKKQVLNNNVKDLPYADKQKLLAKLVARGFALSIAKHAID